MNEHKTQTNGPANNLNRYSFETLLLAEQAEIAARERVLRQWHKDALAAKERALVKAEEEAFAARERVLRQAHQDAIVAKEKAEHDELSNKLDAMTEEQRKAFFDELESKDHNDLTDAELHFLLAATLGREGYSSNNG